MSYPFEREERRAAQYEAELWPHPPNCTCRECARDAAAGDEYEYDEEDR